MIKFMRSVPHALFALGAIVCVAGCSSSTTEKAAAKPAGPPMAHITASNANNSLAKYIELVGFRITEKTPGKLVVQFGVVNHSSADVGDVKLKVNLTTTAAKPDEAPLISFPAQVSGLGPSDMKNVTVDVPAKLRAYELPDWQFLIARFEITEPQ
jgi:hypothetical protein